MRIVVLAAAAASALAIASAASASHDPSPPTEPPKDFANGGGHASVHQFGFDAHSGPLGERPGGLFSTNIERVGSFSFRPICVRVDGNRATFAGPIHHATGTFTDRTNAKVTVVDNGEPSVIPGAPSPDQIAISTDIGTDCATEAPVLHLLQKGNILVHDGNPK